MLGPFIGTLACLLSLFILLFLFGRRRRSCLPPGPTPWPLLGNIFQIPDSRAWRAHKSLSDAYGPITYYEHFGQPTILISSPNIAVDLFDRRSHNYSDRPQNVVMGAELVGWNRAISFHPSSPRHSYYRKLLNNAVNPSAVHLLDASQERSACRLVSRFLQNPDQWYSDVRLTISETLVKICFGRDCSTDEFPYVAMAESTNDTFNMVAAANSWPVDYLPILKYFPEWLPGMGFKRKAKQWRAELDKFAYSPYNIVMSDVNSGNAQPSYVGSLIDACGGTPDDQEREAITWSAFSFFSGGIDTTTAAILTFIMLMCRYPDIQRRAQEEIQSVVGPGRLPTINDRPQLPFLAACLQEMFRLHPIVPLGVAKRAKQDDFYEGYLIPAGTTIVPNIWVMNRDPELYESPDAYIPDRFLRSPDSDVPEHPGYRSKRAFGFGRRSCPGKHLGESMVFIHVASFLAAFDISIPDVEGNDFEQTTGFLDGLITQPKPFKCKFHPRMEGLRDLAERGVE